MKKVILVLAAVLTLLPQSLRAIESVKSPFVKEGEWEVEAKGRWQHDQQASRDDEKEMEYNLAYGVTKFWKTKFESTFVQQRTSDFYYKSTKWENVVNPWGGDPQQDIVWGLYQDISFADRADSSHAFTAGVIGARRFGKIASLGNVFLKRDFGETAKNGIAVVYRWQTKYVVDPTLQPGFEIFGDTGTRNAFRDQMLMIGPVLLGDLDHIAEGLGYEVGYLFGATPATRDGSLKWKMKYAFAF
jgi:hypothetical protein